MLDGIVVEVLANLLFFPSLAVPGAYDVEEHKHDWDGHAEHGPQEPRVAAPRQCPHGDKDGVRNHVYAQIAIQRLEFGYAPFGILVGLLRG